jgi:RNA polymerase sigma-70 factor (ECF subfamily)
VSAGLQSRRLAAALARLPATHRDTLLLVAWGDLTYEQAAIALGVPVGTVRSRLSRARRTLRQALADADPLTAHDLPGVSSAPADSTQNGRTPEETRGDNR